MEDQEVPGPKYGSLDPRAWNLDPYDTHSNATLRLMEAFFSQYLSMTNRIFPRSALERWVRQCRTKTEDELMLLHSLLALGSAFVRNADDFGSICAERAGHAVAAKFGKFSLPLMQSRLLLATFHHAQGREALTWEYGGAMLRALNSENLNTEEGCAAPSAQSSRSFLDLNDEQLRECKRRTFWAAFVWDVSYIVISIFLYNASPWRSPMTTSLTIYQRLGAFCTNTFKYFPVRAVHLRLPSPDQDYEEGMRSKAPLFEWPAALTTNTSLDDGSVFEAFWFSILELLSEAVELVLSNVHQSRSTCTHQYEMVVSEVQARLSKWRNDLPTEIENSIADPCNATENRRIGTASTMLAMYHLSNLHLLRFTRHSLLSKDQIRQRVIAARAQAGSILQIARILCSFAQTLGEGQNLHQMLSAGLGYAVFVAIDTVTAGGYATELEAILVSAMDGLNILQVVGYTWHSCKLQSKLVEKRIEDIQALAQQSHDQSSVNHEGGDKGWRMGMPLEVSFEADYDVMFGLESATFFEILREDR